jgi:hypothetical protein
MHVKAILIPIVTYSMNQGSGAGGEIKGSTAGGEFKYDIFDTL